MATDHPASRFDDITIFETEDGKTRIEVCFEHENVWLPQKLMAELYECSTDNISLHLKHIFTDKELDEESVTEDSSVTAADGKKYRTKLYSLEANHIVDMYLDHAEFQASRGRLMKMRDWAEKLDAFLQFNEQEILQDRGKVEAHDPSSAKDEPPPTPDELKQDIVDLQKLIQGITDRRNGATNRVT